MPAINDDFDRRFINLDRTFFEHSSYAYNSDDIDLDHALYTRVELKWTDILEEDRVIILSEAGTGKTDELRYAARVLSRSGKRAFFLRLEHIAEDFDIAFEEGTLDGFNDWLASNDEAWILLDSVDEAKLKSPRDFGRAVKKLKSRIVGALDRCHIVITGRTSAWRPKSDHDICVMHLPSVLIASASCPDTDGDFSDEIMKTEIIPPSSNSSFKIFALRDLNQMQIRLFAEHKCVANAQDFMDAIERADAYAHTARPQDLEELLQFWNDTGEIGSRREIIERSIHRRLAERDPDREHANPVTSERIRYGAQLLAAAVTLTGRQTILIPGGAQTSNSLPISDVLPNWDQREQEALLSRPIFDEAIYGTVRFHHRSVREYLTASWFAGLLSRQTSRRMIEGLFFKNQYGLDVATPTLRPILPWLALFDPVILDRIMSTEPGILLEGGDPSQLPMHIRSQTLIKVCNLIAQRKVSGASREYGAVQRFAHRDLENDIRLLLASFSLDDGVREFLLRMVWQGRLTGLLAEVRSVALDSDAAFYPRLVSFRALHAIGSEDDMERVRAEFAKGAGCYDRRLLAELIEHTTPTSKTIQWVVASLNRVTEPDHHSLDYLTRGMTDFVVRTRIDDLERLIAGMDFLAGREPHLERRHCEVSTVYSWLLEPISKAIERLIISQHRVALSETVLKALQRVSTARFYGVHDVSSFRDSFSKLIPQWKQLNRNLFWYEVAHRRERLPADQRLTEHWQITVSELFASFTGDDFDYLCNEIKEKEVMDDKLVALSLSFYIYRISGRPRAWREKLKRNLIGFPELEERLSTYLRPPKQTEENRRWKKQHSAWMRSRRIQNEKVANIHADWKLSFGSKLSQFEAAQAANPGALLQPLWYLFNRTRENQSANNRWTVYNWRSLIPEYGEGPARFFRDACVRFWRNRRPKLRSEGAPFHSTEYATIIGLTGLEIEATEDANWARKVTAAEAELACRYASFELNGLPTWLPKLFQAHPQIVVDFLMQEIRYELSVASVDQPTHYILSDVSWSSEWLWDALSPHLLAQVVASEPISLSHLDQILKILQGSALLDSQIAALAEQKWRSSNDPSNLARWSAAWIGTDPDRAIPLVRLRAEGFSDRKERLHFVMELVNKLYGRRNEDGILARPSFMTAPHVKELYEFVSEHILISEDIERAGTGVYSPNVRDHAQEARNGLFASLTKIEGKDAFTALMELAASHPSISHRTWMERHAKERAELDSDIGKWNASDVRDLAEKFERTPRNHAELAELIVFRLLDLKDNLEHGDDSIAAILRTVSCEVTLRVFIGRELREKSNGRYGTPQEEELADAKRPDFRLHGNGFDNPVPIELKLAEKWSGVQLFERMENQLCGDYLRDVRSRRGIFLIVRQGGKQHWQLPYTGERVDFATLVQELQDHWAQISGQYPGVDAITVIGIDLTRRTQ